MSSIALPMNTGVATWNTFSSPIPGGLQYSSFTGSQPDWGVSHENETTAGKNLTWNSSSSGPISSGINEADDNDHNALANAVVRDVLLSAPESEGSQESPNVKNVVEVAGLTGKSSRKKKRRPTVRKNSRYKPTDPNKKPIRTSVIPDNGDRIVVSCPSSFIRRIRYIERINHIAGLAPLPWQLPWKGTFCFPP